MTTLAIGRTLTSGMHVATAHLVTTAARPGDDVLTDARALLSAGHGITHATLQVKTTQAKDCQQLDW